MDCGGDTEDEGEEESQEGGQQEVARLASLDILVKPEIIQIIYRRESTYTSFITF